MLNKKKDEKKDIVNNTSKMYCEDVNNVISNFRFTY